MKSVVGIRHGAVLAVLVGLLGLIPMLDASLGAAVVALFDDPAKAVIAPSSTLSTSSETTSWRPGSCSARPRRPTWTVVGALTGATRLGMLGALLAIPVAADLLLFYVEVLLPRRHQT